MLQAFCRNDVNSLGRRDPCIILPLMLFSVIKCQKIFEAIQIYYRLPGHSKPFVWSSRRTSGPGSMVTVSTTQLRASTTDHGLGLYSNAPYGIIYSHDACACPLSTPLLISIYKKNGKIALLYLQFFCFPVKYLPFVWSEADINKQYFITKRQP